MVTIFIAGNICQVITHRTVLAKGQTRLKFNGHTQATGIWEAQAQIQSSSLANSNSHIWLVEGRWKFQVNLTLYQTRNEGRRSQSMRLESGHPIWVPDTRNRDTKTSKISEPMKAWVHHLYTMLTDVYVYMRHIL